MGYITGVDRRDEIRKVLTEGMFGEVYEDNVLSKIYEAVEKSDSAIHGRTPDNIVRMIGVRISSDA